MHAHPTHAHSTPASSNAMQHHPEQTSCKFKIQDMLGFVESWKLGKVSITDFGQQLLYVLMLAIMGKQLYV